MKRILIVVCILFSINSIFAQGDTETYQLFKYKNALQFELFGHGVIYSLNYERVIFNREKYKTTMQAGGSFYPKSVGFRALWLPIMVNQLFSFHQHHLELGLGHIFTKDNIKRQEPPIGYQDLYGKSDWEHIAGARIGYRFQKPDSRFLFRVAFTPFFEYNKAPHRVSFFDFHPSGGMTFGYNF